MAKVEYFTREAMKPLLAPFGLSEATRVGRMLHLGGQVGMDAGHRIVEGGLKTQALQAFRNIKEIIELAGGSVENIVHLTWYLVESPSGRSFMEDAIDVTAARTEILGGIAPASTAVQVKALLTPEIRVEIQAIAAL